MGYIKEPAGINFVVDPSPLTTEDRKKISEIIAHYKTTGRKLLFTKSKARLRVMRARKGRVTLKATNTA